MQYPEFFSPVQLAWAVWSLSKMSFASQLDGSFGYDRSGSTSKKIKNAKENFTELLCARLSNVTIENDDALKVIQRYDCKDAFHFVDPPYINSDCGHYSGSFDIEGLTKLLILLESISGRFMLTMFPHDLVREYSERNKWTIHRIERIITASKTSRRKQEEWIICNYTV